MPAINGVPASNVGRVVQDFIDDGAVRVNVEANDDGTFTVSAIWTPVTAQAPPPKTEV